MYFAFYATLLAFSIVNYLLVLLVALFGKILLEIEGDLLVEILLDA